MNNLSDAFQALAQSDERAFASATRDASALTHARRARRRARTLQAASGTLAVGAFTVGAAAIVPQLRDDLNPMASPSLSPSPSHSPSPSVDNTEAPAPVLPSRDVAYNTWNYNSNQHATLEQFDGLFVCGAPAPQPSNGRVQIALGDVNIRPETWTDDFTAWLDGTDTTAPVQADADGFTRDAVIADATLTSSQDETLRADVPATLLVVVKDQQIVAMLAPGNIDPREPARVIPNPAGTESGGQDTTVIEYGPDPVISQQPTTFTTGYSGWNCPTGMGDVEITEGGYVMSYPPVSDYLEAGDYEVYVVARVIVSDDTAAEHYLRDQGFDLWNHFTYEEQIDALGLTSSMVGVELDDYGTVSQLVVNAPVPGDYLSAQASDEIVISQPTTVTIP